MGRKIRGPLMTEPNETPEKVARKLTDFDAEVLAEYTGSWRLESSMLQVKRAERRLLKKKLLKLNAGTTPYSYLRTQLGDEVAECRRIK
jgi:hypothetical protein